VSAMRSMEKGTHRERAEFLFAVYDVHNTGGVSPDELEYFFKSSLI